MSLKRAFTKDGGSLIRVRNEDGKIDFNTVLASILGVIILILILHLASLLGVEIPAL